MAAICRTCNKPFFAPSSVAGLCIICEEKAKKILELPFEQNDANASTVRDYFKRLLATLWKEQEGFSGKRPFGNGAWYLDLGAALVKNGYVSGSFDDEGCLNDIDEKRSDQLIADAIDVM